MWPRWQLVNIIADGAFFIYTEFSKEYGLTADNIEYWAFIGTIRCARLLLTS